MYIKSLISALVSLIVLQAYSQESILDPVTVTSSLEQKKISETGRNIITIKGEQLEKLPVHSIDELLRYVPGIEVQVRGAMGAQSNILIRGGTFQQVLIILDGIRLNDPLTGHFNSYIPIAAAEIERIEVLKGASSAIYGTEAVGGVVNIITKTYAAKNDKTIKQLAGQISTGSYGLLGMNAGGVWQNKNHAISAGLVSNNTSGEQLRGTKGYIHNNTVSASYKKHIGNYSSIMFRTAYDNRYFAAQNFYTAFASDTAKEQVNSWWNHARFQYEKGKHRFSVDAGYKQTTDEYYFNKVAAPNLNKSKLWQALAMHSYRISTNSSFTGGVQFTEKSINSNDRGNHSVKNTGIFALLNQRLFNNWHVNPAIRLDYNEISGWEIIPQLNTSYRINKLLLRGSIGKSTREADFTERYNNYNKSFVASGNIGNPALNAERAMNYELGADVFIHSNIKIATTYFLKHYTDLIDWTLTPYNEMPKKDNLSPTGNYFLAKNVANVTTEGFETDIQFVKQINPKKFLFMNAGFVWITSSSSNQTPSLYISSHADFQFNFNVMYRTGLMHFSVNGIYKRRPEQLSNNAALTSIDKDYFTANIKAEADVLKQLSIFLQADNVFDRNYADRFGVVMPGRWISGGLKMQFLNQ